MSQPDDSELRFRLIELDATRPKFDDRYDDYCPDCGNKFETFIGNWDWCPRCASNHVVCELDDLLAELEEEREESAKRDGRDAPFADAMNKALESFHKGSLTLLDFFNQTKDAFEAWDDKRIIEATAPAKSG